MDQETEHAAPPLWVGSQSDSGWVDQKTSSWGRAQKGGGALPLDFCGNPGVISQMRGMLYGAHAGVGSEACIQFCLLHSDPIEAGEMPVSEYDESPVGHMPLTARPEATLSDAHEQETDSKPLSPFA